MLEGAAPRKSIYDDQVSFASFNTPFEQFDTVLQQWMGLEEQIRSGLDLHDLDVPFSDPLLLDYLRMIDLYWALRRQVPESELTSRAARLMSTDLSLAATEFLSRPNHHHH